MKHLEFTGRSFIGGLLLLLMALPVLAQVTTTGRLNGTVNDAAGAVVPNAQISV